VKLTNGLCSNPLHAPALIIAIFTMPKCKRAFRECPIPSFQT